jgi:sortase A
MSLVWFACLLVGLYLLGTFAYGMWSGVREQQRLNQVWSGEVRPRPAPPVVDPALQQPLNGVDFAIRVPKLGYYAAVKEGVSAGVLYASPGHYPTTVWPGDPGMVGVAAHNVYWINFPQLAKGDEIDIETRYGVYRYRVTGSEIVNPDNRSVLIPNANGFHLTLTTCWPLWAGAFATQRYVIFTDQVWPVTIRPGYS